MGCGLILKLESEKKRDVRLELSDTELNHLLD